jgi:hypothetical protein
MDGLCKLHTLQNCCTWGGLPRGCNFSASKYLSYDFSSRVLPTMYIVKIHPFLSTCNSPLLINLSSNQADGYRFMQWLLDIHSFPCWFSVLSKCKIQDFLNVPFSVTCINLPAFSTLWNTCASQLVLHYTTKHTRLCTKLLCKKLTDIPEHEIFLIHTAPSFKPANHSIF